MKILAMLFLCLAVLNVFAGEHKNRHNTPNTSSASIQQLFMQGNNINTTFRSDGIFNYDWITFPAKESGMIWPVTSPSRKTINFTSGVWVGAKINGQIRLAAAAYSSHFTPGIIPTMGQVPPQSMCNDPRYRIYYVQLTDPSLTSGGTRTKTAGGREYTFNFDSWANWPVDLGAPYVEVNNVPGYQPDFSGDRPGVGNSDARPDEISWMVYQDYTNCTNNLHAAEVSLPGGTLPMACQIQQIAFQFNSPGLTDMYFVKWQIINKNTANWDSTYISVFDDADVGADACGAGDDAVGCDTLQNVGYMYNADNNDCNYGGAPPATGYKYLQSPILFTGNPNDSVFLPYDTLVGYRALGLSGFNYFVNGAIDPCLNDPDEFNAGYNFMKGLDGCGRPKINPFTLQPTLFSFDGNGCSRSGTNNWFDSTAGHDARFMQNSGPFTMNSGDTQVVVIGSFVGRGADNIQSLCALLNNAARVQRIYNLNFRSIPLPPPPQVSSVAVGDGKVTLYWTGNAEPYYEFDKIDLTGFWVFEGYEIYQIRPGTGGDNPADRRLLAVYDVVQDGLDPVYDSVEVQQPNGTIQIEYKPVTFGSNSGISRTITLTQNAFPSGVNSFFINGQQYRFAVLAYGVNKNAVPGAKVLKNSIGSQIITVTPNYPLLGTQFVNNSLDTLVTNRVDRGFLPVVIDPLKVISARYQMVFNADTSWNLVRIINNSQVDTMLRRNKNIYIGDNKASIVDGILFKADTIAKANVGVIRDPGAGAQTSGKGWTYSNSNLNLAGVDTTGLTINYPTGNFKAMQNLSMGLSWPSGNTFKSAFTSRIDTNFLKTSSLKRVKITFGQTQKAYRYRGAVNNSPYVDYVDVPFKVEIDDPIDTNSNVPRQVNVLFYDGDSSGTWNPKVGPYGGLEILYIMYSTYDPNPNAFYPTRNINFATQFRQLDVQYVWWPRLINDGPAYQAGDIMTIIPYTQLKYQQSPGTVTVTEVSTTAPTLGSLDLARDRGELDKVRVVPNPYYGGHSQETSPFDRFVRFMNLPKTATIYIYSLNGDLVRQINKDDNTTSTNWDLLNTDRIPIASGIYIAYIDAPGIGTKTVKLAIFTPEERLDAF